jgi:hypothetical protein
MYVHIYIRVCVCVCMCVYQDQCTPLFYAVGRGHGKIVEMLVEAKAALFVQHSYVSVLKERRGMGHALK